MWLQSSFPSFYSLFQTFKCLTNTSLIKASSGHPNLISPDCTSSTMINNKGLNTEPWCNPTSNRKLLHQVHLTLTGIWADHAILTNHLPMPSFFKIHLMTSLSTSSKAFSKSTIVKNKFFFFLLNIYLVFLSK